MLDFEAPAVLSTSLTMSSREIAELTGKEHRNVLRDIRGMLAELHGEDRLLSFEQTVTRPNPSGGAPISSVVYNLPKRETLILVSGYNIRMRARIIDRWQELEAQQAKPSLPKTYADALRLYADEVEAREKAEEQARVAVATKALIGNKREATAMATASAAVRKVNELKEQLDISKEFASTKRMQAIFKHEFDWRMLKRACEENGWEVKKVFDANYGDVNAYPACAWEHCYCIRLTSTGAEIIRKETK